MACLDEASAALAHHVAALLYPGYADSTIPQVIKYEKDIVRLRKAMIAQLKAVEEAKAERRAPRWKQRVLKQGPWDEGRDFLNLNGAPALPMPVAIRYVVRDDILLLSCPSWE